MERARNGGLEGRAAVEMPSITAICVDLYKNRMLIRRLLLSYVQRVKLEFVKKCALLCVLSP